jgi:general secretion pathway protein I
MPLRARNRLQGGFSLLEMMVAIAILALSLGALYQATSGATRNVRSDEKYAYGVELAQSLLANYAVVPLGGLSRQGETAGGFLWQVSTRPVKQGGGQGLPAGSLQDIEVTVRWSDGHKARQVVLNSVVEGRAP